MEKNKNQPISSLDISEQMIEKTLSGLHIIRGTGESLIDFVTNYRSLTRLPEPHLSSFKIETLFSKVMELMQEEIEKGQVSLSSYVSPEGLELIADINQLEKVLINLIKNSTEALAQKNDGIIRLEAIQKPDSIFIHIEDNGPGISPELLEDIFIPFFTTKTKGSGIGLSISRQIVLKHEGTLSVHSIQGEKTVFSLEF